MVVKPTTPALLAESLHELAVKKPLDKITVREIASNCGVTTATFYNHFQDKYELIFWIYDYQVTELLIDFESGDLTWYETVVRFIQFLEEDEVFYRNALMNTHGQDSLLVNASRQMVATMTRILEASYPGELTPELHFDLRFYLSGLAHATFQWLFHAKDVSATQMADYFMNVIPDKLKVYLTGSTL